MDAAGFVARKQVTVNALLWRDNQAVEVLRLRSLNVT